ncbi:MAG: hypothetical protein U1E51_02875, partial [Candidatus Binatia bacterium]|nr:hypothetical protein [Candidatus Binatia bacterium]
PDNIVYRIRSRRAPLTRRAAFGDNMTDTQFQLAPAKIVAYASGATFSLRCPACSGTVHVARAGSLLQAECAYCKFRQTVRERDGAVIQPGDPLRNPDKAPRIHGRVPTRNVGVCECAGCENKANTAGMCHAHYLRWRLAGHPDQVKFKTGGGGPIKGKLFNRKTPCPTT